MKLLGELLKRKSLRIETINAAGVLQVPLVISVWDDDYFSSCKTSNHQREYFRKGFQRNDTAEGYEILRVKMGLF
jgi:hypothetical protein